MEGPSFSSPYILCSDPIDERTGKQRGWGTLLWSPRESGLPPRESGLLPSGSLSPKLPRLTIHKAVEKAVGFALVSVHGDHSEYL